MTAVRWLLGIIVVAVIAYGYFCDCEDFPKPPKKRR
jgi:hypothetical protein